MRRDPQRRMNHGEADRCRRAEKATAADIHSYVNGQRSTSAEPKLEAAEVDAIWDEGPGPD